MRLRLFFRCIACEKRLSVSAATDTSGADRFDRFDPESLLAHLAPAVCPFDSLIDLEGGSETDWTASRHGRDCV